MTIADDMDPISCLGLCLPEVERNLINALNHMPDVDDSPEEAAKKYAILGRCLRGVKEYTKEALKAVQIGSDGAARNLLDGAMHHSLAEYDDAKIAITGPDGKTVETTFGKFDRACEAVQKDPGVLDKLKGGEQ